MLECEAWPVQTQCITKARRSFPTRFQKALPALIATLKWVERITVKEMFNIELIQIGSLLSSRCCTQTVPIMPAISEITKEIRGIFKDSLLHGTEHPEIAGQMFLK